MDILLYPHMVGTEKGRQLSDVSSYKTVIPSMKALSLWSNYLPNSLSSTISPLDIGISKYEFCSDANIQSLTLTFFSIKVFDDLKFLPPSFLFKNITCLSKYKKLHIAFPDSELITMSHGHNFEYYISRRITDLQEMGDGGWIFIHPSSGFRS